MIERAEYSAGARKSRLWIAISTLRRLREAGGHNLTLRRWGDAVERHDAIREIKLGCGQVFAQVRDGRTAGDQQDVGRAAQQPGKRNLHRGGTEAEGNAGQGR